MLKRLAGNAWLRHIGVAVAYALGYIFLKERSFAHWYPLASLRLCALLFAPYRYWPALLVGETGALVYTSADCGDQFGELWKLFYIVPPMAFIMPVVRWCREQKRLFPTKRTTSMNVLLTCALSLAAISTIINIFCFSFMRLPPNYVYSYTELSGRYFLGNYLGILAFTPLVLLVREEMVGTPIKLLWQRVSQSRLAMESISLLLPVLVLLAWMDVVSSEDARQVVRITMFLPVAWLSFNHGWRGAAVGGAFANIAIIAAMPDTIDHGTMVAQVFVAFALSTILLLGARIATLHERERQGRINSQMALAMAQRNVSLGEMQLRQASYVLEQISGAIQSTHNQMLSRLRFLLPSTDERSYYRKAAATQQQMYRLADTLYPLAWRDRGLPAAMREGSVPRALDEAGISYSCDIGGNGLSQLSATIHMALYRLACEAIATTCSRRDVCKIAVRLRGGGFGNRRWAALVVDAYSDVERSVQVNWDELLPVLGGSGMGLAALRDRAAVFEGKARMRSCAHGQRISLILFDSAALLVAAS